MASASTTSARVLTSRADRCPRMMLLVLAFLNIIFISCTHGEVLFGLVPTCISLPVNIIILGSPRVFGHLSFRILADFLFTFGFMTWFVFANIFLSNNYWRQTNSIIVGTWSAVVTLIMFFLSTGLFCRDLLQLSLAVVRMYDTRKLKPRPTSARCNQCAHCRAQDPALTARDGAPPSPWPVSWQPLSLIEELRQLTADYIILPQNVDQQYHDFVQEDGKIHLSEENGSQYQRYQEMGHQQRLQRQQEHAHDEEERGAVPRMTESREPVDDLASDLSSAETISVASIDSGMSNVDTVKQSGHDVNASSSDRKLN